MRTPTLKPLLAAMALAAFVACGGGGNGLDVNGTGEGGTKGDAPRGTLLPDGRASGARAAGRGQVVDLSWVGATHGWALVADACANGERCATIYRTTDRGANWTRLAALDTRVTASVSASPPCEERGCVGAIRFVNADVGYLFGPGFQTTTDGGRTWTPSKGRKVSSVAAARKRVYRVTFSHTGCPGPCDEKVERSAIGSRDWTTLNASLPQGGIGSKVYGGLHAVYAISYRNLAGGATSHATIAISLDDGSHWSSRPAPCEKAGSTQEFAAAADVRGNALAILCRSRDGSAPSLVTVSSDGGRQFGRQREVPLNFADLIALGGRGVIAVADAGVTGNGSFTYRLALSTDSGRTWLTPVRDRQPLEGMLDVGGGLQFHSERDVSWIAAPRVVWRSIDGGQTWRRAVA